LKKAASLCVPHADRPAALPASAEAASRRQVVVLPTFGLTDVPLFAAFALTYAAYAPRVTPAAAFPSTLLRTGLDGPFDRAQGRLF